MNLHDAAELAWKIHAILAPYCARLEIAGSIRRARPHVNDIDLVALPKPDQIAAFRARCQQNATVVTNGEQTVILRLKSGVQLDLWIARQPAVELFNQIPTNFGSLLLCRTGSREHNIWLIEEAKKRDLIWDPYSGVWTTTAEGAKAKLIASETEEDIFDALSLGYIPPVARERHTSAPRDPKSEGPVWANAFSTQDE